MLQSQTLDTTWAAVDVAAPTGSQTAPDGTSTAWLLTADSASSQTPYVRQSPTFSGSTQYTMVGHLKAGTASHGYISFRTQNGYSAYALLDFSGGTVSHAGFGDFTGVTSSVTALGSSWFKVTLTATTGTNLSGSNVLVGISDGTTPVGAGYATWNSAGETMYAWGVQLATTNAKVYDSPTTTQISRSYQTKLQTAASGAARFEHSATDGQSEGILIEGQSTNLVTYSETLATGWTEGRSTLTAASGVAPDGTLTSNLFTVDGTAANSHNAYFEYASGGATPQTFSIFAKKGNVNFLCLRFGPTHGTFTDGYVFFDLANGTKGTVTGAISASSIVDCGNGWYRCSITSTALQSGTARAIIYVAQADSTLSFDGNSYDHIQVWGAQIEANQSFSSSYLKSDSGSTTTRAADSLSVATSEFGFAGGPVSVVGEFKFLEDEASPVGSWTAAPRLMTIAGSSDEVEIFRNTADGANTLAANVEVNGTDYQALATTTNTGSGVDYKVGLSLQSGSIKGCMNGGAVAENTNAVFPDISSSTLYVGSINTTQGHLNGHVKRVALYNEALSDTNLQAITS